jgi:hypothetical protein
LDTTPQGKENGSSLGNIGVAFPMRGGGWGPRSSLFLLVRCGNCGEVGVLDKKCGAGLEKNKMGLMLLAQRLGYGVVEPSETNGFS